MSSVISSETYSCINTLTKEYKITNTSNKSGKSTQILKSQLMELTKKTPSEPNPLHSSNLKSWLQTLSPSTLFSVFSSHNPLICTFLIQMNLKILSDGNFDFALIEKPEKKISVDDLGKLFYMRKVSREEKVMKKKELEGFLRFLDTEDYLDTLCLEQKPLRNLEHVLGLFDTLTTSSAFQVPCCAYWDGLTRRWLHEYPAWHIPSKFNSLVHWACACLEREVWIKFFKMNNLDPRLPSEQTDYVNEYKVLHSIETVLVLPELLRTLSKQAKEDLIGDHATISRIFQDVKKKLGNFNPNNCAPKNQNSFFVSRIDSAKNFQNPESIGMLLQIMKNHSEEVLVEYLLCTPLDRTASIYDLTLRIVSMKVREMYTKKVADELLRGAIETEKPKKLKKRRKKVNKSKEIHERKEEEDVTRDLVKKAMQDMYEFIEATEEKQVSEIFLNESKTEERKVEQAGEQIDESEFQTVNKKKPRKPQQEFKPNTQTPKQKTIIKNTVVKPQPIVQIQNRSEKFLKSSWQTSQLKLQSSANPIDFPPLSSMSIHNSSPLHIEIVQFVSSTLSSLSKKYQVLSVICIQINEIISKLFSGTLFLYGSYATGLAVENSDIDLAVDCKEVLTREQVQKNCLDLSAVLSTLNFILSCNAIITASVPLVKVSADLQSFAGVPLTASIDIIFVNHEKTGNSLIKANNFMCDIQISLPQIHPLAITLKSFLYEHDLNSVYQGGISSYSLVIWIAAFIESMEKRTEDLGEVLLQFLQYFGNAFDPNTTGVQVLGVNSFFALSHGENVVTIDPVNELNNTTRGSFKVNDVLRHFSLLNAKLRELLGKSKFKGLLKTAFEL